MGSTETIRFQGVDYHIPGYGNYEMVGSGANAFVLTATDILLSRRVAIKVYPIRRGRRAATKEKALAESKKIATLDHPNIVKVMAGRFLQGGVFALTMEFVDGCTAEDFLDSGPALADRVQLWLPIIAALKYAHRLGVYHGDLHPRNVMIRGHTPVIIDFGTSIFARTAIESARRDVVIMHRFAVKTFPEMLKLGIDYEFAARCTPELMLFSIEECIQIVSEVEQFSKWLSRQESDEELDGWHVRNYGYSIGHAWERLPIISPRSIYAYMDAARIPQQCMYAVFDTMRSACSNYPNIKGRRSFLHDALESIEQKIVSIEGTIAALQQDFLSGDPHKTFYRFGDIQEVGQDQV